MAAIWHIAVHNKSSLRLLGPLIVLLKYVDRNSQNNVARSVSTHLLLCAFHYVCTIVGANLKAISVEHRLHFWNTEWIFVPRLRGYPSALPFALPAYYQHLRIDKRSDKAGFLKWQNSGDVEACGPLAHVHVCHHNQALFGFTERKRFSKRRPL
ncbi:hypothetical protein D917_05746 [Trichinella nativa]|uniref:Uncharacterized protein n=1 Tax=Trichinella nativa TaxID=6335 RepID=A0A1Y3EV61_9BILA|nr:hypothetical protein D917_05746 [Trichinella nativa]